MSDFLNLNGESKIVPDRDESSTGADLTEEDIFRMKSLSMSQQKSELADQSVVSLADSASNFDEHVPDESTDGAIGSYGKEDGVVGAGQDDEEDGSVEEEDAVEQRRFYGGFVFDRRRSMHLDLPKDTVTELRYPFEPTAFPRSETNEAEYRAAFAEARLYLVGTAHFSAESQQDVLRTIESVQPDMVMVELCPARISILSMDEEMLLREAKDLTMEKIITTIKQSGVLQGVLHVLLLSMSASITKQLGMAPGGEFRAAFRGAQSVNNCRLILGDRPIHVTLQRALASLSAFQKMRLFWHILIAQNTTISKEDVERCKQSDLLQELLKQMAGEYPQLSKIFVDERDQYMANGLHTLLRKRTMDKRAAWHHTDAAWQPVSVVAVVGIGHVPGIVKHWNDSIDVTDLLSIPQPTWSSLIVKATFKGVLYGVVAYGAYRLGKFGYFKLAPIWRR